MKSIDNDYLKKVINEAVKGMLKEDGGLGITCRKYAGQY